MKKTIITLLAALLLLPFAAEAQYRLQVKYNNQVLYEKDVWDVDSITFVEIEKKPIEGATPKVVDLGLNVNWADVNLGAASPKEAGWLVGWGDLTGKNVSTKVKWYPVEVMKLDNISDNDAYDIAKQYFGSPWRLPVDEEYQELIEKCTWTWVEEGDSVGFVVTSNVEGYTDKHIFLPAVGYREGEARSVSPNYYWSGSLNTADGSTETAKALSIANGTTTPTLADVKRYFGCAIRPVNGELNVNVSITAGDAYNLDYTSATIDVQLGDSYKSYPSMEYGLYYSTNPDLTVEADRKSVVADQLNDDGKYTFNLSDLTPHATYYYAPYVLVRGKIVSSETGNNFSTPRFKVPEIVDMGLSVRWASFNVGATAPLESGNYIGWGDATGELTSTISDYYARGNTSAYIGGNKDYDVAQASWGDKWRMPRRSEIEELFDETKCTVEEASGFYRFTSKTNGNSIILPKSGVYTVQSPNTLSFPNYAWYWTADANTDDRLPFYALFNAGSVSFSNQQKAMRMQIRAVYQQASDYSGGNSGSGEDDDDPGNTGGNSGDSGSTTPVEPVTNEAGVSVDLGLSVLWADRNVGAAKETGTGYYLEWGDLEARDYSYESDNYIYYQSNYTDGLTKNGYKYLGTGTNTSSSYFIGGTDYDAAHVLWKGKWRMPKPAEINELIENCTWTWTSRSDATLGTVFGYEVKSKTNGKSIFLPARGYKSTDIIFGDRDEGYYWSGQVESSIPAIFNQKAYNLYFSESEPGALKNSYRYVGLLIRPVMDK